MNTVYPLKSHNLVVSKSFNNKFMLNSDIHNYNTRSSTLFNQSKCRTNRFKNSITYRGPKVWNELPEYIRYSPTLNVFKKQAKIYFVY